MAKRNVSQPQETQKEDKTTIDHTQAEDLAVCLAGVLNSKLCPQQLHDDIVDSLNEIQSRNNVFTLTAKEFERLENLSSSVFDLNNSLAEWVSGNGEGLNHCLGLVAHDFDNLVCDVREREEKKQGGAV